MNRISLNIEGIPAILWGDPADKLMIAVHGSMSCKDDTVIAICAEEAAFKGTRVLSFDLPGHGVRKNTACTFQNCIADLETVYAYASGVSKQIGVFACSMGAYFCLQAYKELPVEQCLFLSPILNMARVVKSMMAYAGLSEELLEKEKEIKTASGQIFYWDDYSFANAHPVKAWDKNTSVLYGKADTLTTYYEAAEFAERYHCALCVMETGEHFFHTEEQLKFYRSWLKESITI